MSEIKCNKRCLNNIHHSGEGRSEEGEGGRRKVSGRGKGEMESVKLRLL